MKLEVRFYFLILRYQNDGLAHHRNLQQNGQAQKVENLGGALSQKRVGLPKDGIRKNLNVDKHVPGIEVVQSDAAIPEAPIER